MERRVLIVESQNDLALTMASVLKNSGFQTSLASNAADAQRELEKRRPDLVVLRAELPDQNGFTFCGVIRKGRFGPNLPVILLSSDVGPEALHQHSQSPNAANAYLPIPFEMGELSRLSTTIVPPIPTASPSTTADDMDADLDNALSGNPVEVTAPAAPPPLRTGGPPRLPRRERRSALTDEDKQFLDRAFQSIADRKAELLAESREVRRPPSRREMGTPEAKIQILRDELKSREAQIARISEIWSVRERELLSVEDRINEKDVEIQGLKMQQDDLTRRLNESQNTLVEKEREHGRQVEDLLLQKFIGEKEVIEVVSAKEKEINGLRREKSNLEEELGRRTHDLEASRAEFEQLEKDFNLATLEFEVKEKQGQETLAARDASITDLHAQVDSLNTQIEQTVAERDTKYADFEGQLTALNETLEQTHSERNASVRDLESRLRLSVEHAERSDAEGERLTGELGEARTRAAEKIGDLEGEIATLHTQLEALGTQKAEVEQTLNEKISERDGRINHLEGELTDTVEAKDRQEADLQSQIQEKLERIGELEGEVEAARAALVDREAELTAELGELGAAKDHLEETLTAQLNEASATIQAQSGAISELEQNLAQRNSTIEELNTDLADRDGTISALELAVTERNTSIDGLNRDLAQRNSSIATLEQTLAQRNSAIDGLNNDVAERDTTIVELEQNLAQRNSTIDGLNNDVAERDTKVGDLESRLSAAHETIADRDGEVSALKQTLDERNNEINALEGTLADRDETITRLTVSLDETQKALLATQQGLNESQATLEAKTLEQAQTIEVLQRTQADLSQVRGERDERTGELSSARNEVQRFNGLLRQSEANRAQMEEELSGQLGQLRTELSEAQGNYEAEAAAHATLGQETTAAIAALTGERNGLSQRLEASEVDLAATRSNLDDTSKSLDIEKRAHADTSQHFESRVSTLEGELAQAREHGEDVGDQLAATQKELGARVADLTQLNAKLAHSEDTRHHLEERIATLTEESQRREELLQNDMATKSKELADTLRKLTTMQQEKVRQVDVLTRDVTAKTEQNRQLETKLKTLFDESKKKTDDLGLRISSLSGELEATKKDIAEKGDALTRATEGQQAALHERDQVRAQLQSSVQQANARIQEANAAIAQERGNAKKIADEAGQRAQRAEARIAQVQQEAQSKHGEMETRLKESQAQLGLRQRRIAELEQAVEGANAKATRAEKEFQAKGAATEQKAADLNTRLAATMQERKTIDERHKKDLEDATAKHKAELERRDQVKAQEVKRLQDAVQEKSKQLKVVELELARYKNKPGVAAPTSSPSRSGAPATMPSRPPHVGDEEASTNINALPPVTTRPSTAPKPPLTRPPVAITPAGPQKTTAPPKDDRTVVTPGAAHLPPATKEDEEDFTSIIADLGD